MTLTASDVTEEDKQAFSVPERTWETKLQFKFQRMLMHCMAPGVSAVFEKFEMQELLLLVQLMRHHNRKQRA